jgi:hypothetical protein
MNDKATVGMKRQPPGGGINLSARYPQYEAGVDARDIKKAIGKWGNVVHGFLLGKLHMPATIADENGEFKPWTALCFELLEECPAKFPDPENAERVVVKNAPVGSRIIMTLTTTLESLYDRGLKDALEDVENVYEIWLQPQAGKTKNNQSLWLYPEFHIMKKLPRKQEQRLVLTAGRAPAGALPAGGVNSGPQARAPQGFDAGATKSAS